MRPPGASLTNVPAPDFARFTASVFIDAQAQRHNSDYDLNAPFSERDAHELRKNCHESIKKWQDATSPDERDFKDALAILMLLKGQLRKDD